MDWNSIYETYQLWLMRGCFVALCALMFAMFVVKVLPAVKDAFSKLRKRTKLEQWFVMFNVVGMTLFAGTKSHFPNINFEVGLKNDGSLITNDTVHIEWVKTGTPYIPDSADLYVDYRLATATNEEWMLLGQTTVGAYEFNTTLANATNYNYNVWYYYVPSAPVHTNGVWEYRTMPARKQTPGTLKAIPLRAATKGDGRAIATPAAKRKEEDNQ